MRTRPPLPPRRAHPRAPIRVRARHARTGARLGRAVLGYLVVVVLVVTLAPFAFHIPEGVRVVWWTPDGRWNGVFDPIANVALFAPLGFLYALTRAAVAPAARGTLPRAWAGGLVLSTAIETVQMFEPARYPSPTDVATNALGALLGAWLHRRLAHRLRADALLAGGFALELPVMGLVYVALPLVTLCALTVGDGPVHDIAFPPRPGALVALGVFGAMLLGTVQRRRVGPSDPTPAVRRALVAAAAAALWFGVGALPALANAPGAFGVGLGAAAVVAAVVSTAVVGGRGEERRFEGEAIGRAAPFLALSLALYPFGQTAASGPLSDGDLLRALEALCGFAVLGYLLAEAWGRRELRYRYAVWRVGLAAGAAAVAQGLLAHGTEAAAGPALAEVAARALCAAYGGWIYHLQRAHVRALVDSRRVRGTASNVPARAAATAAAVRARLAREIPAVFRVG